MTTDPELLAERLPLLPLAHLGSGPHTPNTDGRACVMEAVAWVAGEPWSDHPECASPVIGAFLRSWNDSLPDDLRQSLLAYVPRLVGSKGSPEQEDARAWMALDWLVRVHTPAWLRLAGLDEQAGRLEGLSEFVAGMDVPSVRPVIDAVRSDAAAARDAARAAAGDAAWDAAGAAAWAAARDAARDAAGDAAWDAAGAAARDAARDAARAAARDAARAAARAAAGDAARDAARAAARAAARDAAWAALTPTRDHLITTAHDVVDRMLRVTETKAVAS